MLKILMENSTYRKNLSFRQFVTYLLGVVVLLFLVIFLWKNRDVLLLLKNVSIGPILLIILFDLAIFVITGFMDRSMISRFDSRVSFWDCYMLGYANNFLNKILPTIGGGAAFRAVYLKKKYGLSYSQFVSTIAGLYVISFLPHSLIGMICLLVIFFSQKMFSWLIFLAFMGIFLFCLVTIIFSPKITDEKNSILRFLGSIFEGWHILKGDKKLIATYAFFSMMLLVFAAAQAYLSYDALGVQTNMISMVFLATLGIILAFLNFTPDGIGVKEGVYAFSSNLVQISNGVLVLGSLLLRGISICTTFVIGGICYFYLSRKLNLLENRVGN